MPLYEYRCAKCGKVFERIQKFSDQPLTVHDDCGGPVERLISVSALNFKGSGWYVNDYAKGGARTSSSSEPKAESKTESKSESSSGESKSSESKTSESKSSESKSSDSKPAAA